MKNLKKVLALGLALVMMMGMFTIASAAETKKVAADFTDWDKVEHKDAVALCVDLGIINGLPDGSFGPDQTIDRASWAKLVYFTATGDDNADAYLGTATGLKDIKGNWAESYINYLFANKYVSGDTLGNYQPAGTVTVAAGAKTMLTVLGYDADDRGYQNDAAWAGNIITDAKRTGLMDDIARSNTAMVNLTRDNAAQMVYNALQAATKEPEYRRDNGESYVVKYEDGPVLGLDVFGIIPVTAIVSDVNDGKATFSDADPAAHLALLNGAEIKASAANIGNKVTVFINKDGKSVVSTAVAKAGVAADKVFTDKVVIAHLTNKATAETAKDKDHFVAAPADGGVSYYLNGENSTAINTQVAAATYAAGNKVEVFLTEGKVSMVKVTTYTAEKVTGDVETRTYKDKLQVKVPGVTGLTTFVDADTVEGYQGLAKDDVVLRNESKDVIYLQKAEKVTGKVTRKSDSKLTINGTAYAESGISAIAAADKFADWAVKDRADNEYDFFLDLNGDVCQLTKISGEVETKVAYVLQAKFLTNAGSAWDSTSSLQANLLFDDATTQVVTIAKVGSKDEDFADSDATALVGKLVDYSVNSKGNYELTVKSAETEPSNKTVSQKPEFASGLKADLDTLFLVEKTNGEDDSNFYVYTGYKNVPAMTADKIVANAKDGVVTCVYLQTSKFDGEGSDGLIYVKDASKYDEDVDGNQVYEIVNAEGKEEFVALTGETPATGTFYIISSTDDKDVATIRAIKTEDKVVSIAAANDALTVGKGIVTLKGDKTYSYDNSTVAVVIDTDADGFVGASSVSLDNFKAGEQGYTYTVKAIVDSDNLQYIYIIRTVG